jgi:hypothetical protein
MSFFCDQKGMCFGRPRPSCDIVAAATPGQGYEHHRQFVQAAALKVVANLSL